VTVRLTCTPPRDNTVTTNALSTKSRSSSRADQMCVPTAFGRICQIARKVEALWSVWTVGVGISLGAWKSAQRAGFVVFRATSQEVTDAADAPLGYSGAAPRATKR